MPRTPLIKTSEFPYHITIRSNNADWFELPMKSIWYICISALRHSLEQNGGKVIAFVLMNNHYHLLLYTPNSNIDRFMQVLNQKISKDIRWRTGRKNRIFGDRYKWKLITDESYLVAVIRYIFQNPVRAGICKNVENYEFSTLYSQVRNQNLYIKIYNCLVNTNHLEFLNTIPESVKSIRKDLHIWVPGT